MIPGGELSVSAIPKPWRANMPTIAARLCDPIHTIACSPIPGSVRPRTLSWSSPPRSGAADWRPPSAARSPAAQSKVQIIRKISASASSGDEEDDEDGGAPRVHTVRVPASQPRARQEIIVPGGSKSAPRRVSHDLILAIARAQTWMQDLRSGRYGDTGEIARCFKLNDAHVRRILRFGYLAPDIIEAIVEGRQPRSLTVKRLLQGIPCAWSEQRAVFGFPS